MIVPLGWYMTYFLKWYFESIFIPKRIVLTVILKLLSFWVGVSTICKLIFSYSLWNDIYLSFWNEQSIPVFVLKCFMTVILKWGRQKFSYTKLFSLIKTEEIYWRKSAINNIFRIQIFTQCQCPYTCVEIHFIMKGGICNIRF